jgi:hypothetical protein
VTADLFARAHVRRVVSGSWRTYAVCLALAASGCGGAASGDRGAASDDPDPAQTEWTVYELPAVGLTVSYPASWARSREPLMPSLADPKELVSLSTFTPREGGENCAHMPENAIEAMGPTDALVVVEERVGAPGPGTGTLADYPERPDRFGPDDGYPSEAVDCLDERKAFFDRFIPFRDSGRRFFAYIAYGTETPPDIRTQAWTILNRLDIEPLG